MKLLAAFTVMVCFQYVFAKDEYVKELSVKHEKVVTGIGFSVIVPKAWSYINVDATAKPFKNLSDDKLINIGTSSILMSPETEVGLSKIYFSVANYIPRGVPIENIYKAHAQEGAKLSTQKWDGREWQVLEYVLTYNDLDKKLVTRYNLHAVTHLKDHDVAVMAGVPTPELRDQYRKVFENIMKTVKVISK